MRCFNRKTAFLLVITMMLSLIQTPEAGTVQAANTESVYEECIERVEDNFRYLDDFYVNQYPQAAVRSRLTMESDVTFVNELAKKITEGCSNDKERADTIAKWIDGFLGYKANASAFVMDGLYTREGNCVTYAMLMEELLHQLEIPAIVGTGWRADVSDMKHADENMFNTEGHAWCFVNINGEWLLYDILFGEYGISDREYIAKWYYLRDVDFIIPVYDSENAPIGFHKYSDYENVVYYCEGKFVCLKKDGNLSNSGRLYHYENNYLIMYNMNTSEGDINDGTDYAENPEREEGMLLGELYRDGWLLTGPLVYTYCFENGTQMSSCVMEYKGEKYYFNGMGAKVLIPEGEYRIENGYLTVEKGYQGDLIEVVDEEYLGKENAVMTVRTEDTNILSVSGNTVNALECGMGTIAYAVQKKGDTGYLIGHSLELQVVDKFREYDLNDYPKEFKSGVSRVSGETRYETSFNIADSLKNEMGVDKFNSVIIASGDNFPDALAGSYLAAKEQAPILMTNGKNVTELYAYIDENINDSAKKTDIDIYILGGKVAVPEKVERGLIEKGYTVKRLSGDDRYKTNIAILEEAGVTNEEILVCTGTNFADSLSASASGLPILLVDPKKGQLSEQQKNFLNNTDSQISIIGGTAAVNEKYESVLSVYDHDGKIERVKGETRYQTSVAVAEKIFGGKNPYSAVIAYAMNFPDGLCGGPLAYFMNAPMLLTGPTMKGGVPMGSEETATIDARNYVGNNNINHGVVLGGTAALSNNSVQNIFGSIE